MMKLLERYYRGKFLEKSKKEDVLPRRLATWMRSGDATPLVVSVNETNALQVPVFFGALSVFAQSLAMLPLIVYRRLEGDERERATDEPEYGLFKTAVNSRMTSYEWRFGTVFNLIMKGNSFSKLHRDSGGKKVLAMELLDHSSYEIRDIDNVLIRHKTRPEGELLKRDDILHLKWFTKDGSEGQGILDFCPAALGFLIAAERYGKSFFESGALPFVLLIYPGELSDVAKSNILSSWKKKHQGRGSEPAILEEGMEVKTLIVPNDTAQFLELRQFQVAEIARFFRITPHKLQDLERATFSNVTELNQSFIIDSLMPQAANIQQRIQLDVFRKRDELFAEFLFDDMLRGLLKERYDAYRTAIQNRILTVNEVRRLENRNVLTQEQIDENDKILAKVNQGGNLNKTNPNVPSGREASQGE